MITKERLEELIKEEKYVFSTWGGEIKYLKPDEDYLAIGQRYLEQMFETEEDAKWELEMTSTYTDTLKLANYTDFENENGDRVFYHKGTTYELSLWWASDNTKIIRITWNGRDGFGCIFEKPLTKENYIEACKMATYIHSLHEQLAEKDQQLERQIAVNKEMDKIIGEKDKEIEQLSKEHLEMFGDMKDYKNLWLAEQRKNKEIRKQVCDEIRMALTSTEPNCSMEDLNSNLYEFSGREIYAILEQIKKGE